MELITLKQALQETNNILNGISVPMGLFQQIGMPIMSAMGNLNECINAIGDVPEAESEQAPIGRQEPDPNEEKAIREEDL